MNHKKNKKNGGKALKKTNKIAPNNHKKNGGKMIQMKLVIINNHNQNKGIMNIINKTNLIYLKM